ncbi:MAG: hypothetical protein OXE78_05710 [Gammaproteobacteria bacterium]|nr:hypothetical protein [Gammaproteobacteria bacterium]MCY4358651.1 hypothetical protein [Gammaproteobacteria bacterium]
MATSTDLVALHPSTLTDISPCRYAALFTAFRTLPERGATPFPG